jgi:hypothetical protein
MAGCLLRWPDGAMTVFGPSAACALVPAISSFGAFQQVFERQALVATCSQVVGS